jgi:DNA-binding LacI/PurR family transcriptional regulator
MGRIAAETVIGLIERKHAVEPRIVIEPELVVRASTSRVRGSDGIRSRTKSKTV